MTDPDDPQADPAPSRIERRNDDTHAETRFFKLVEVAYNCARNGYYARAAAIAAEAVNHHEEALAGVAEGQRHRLADAEPETTPVETDGGDGDG